MKSYDVIRTSTYNFKKNKSKHEGPTLTLTLKERGGLDRERSAGQDSNWGRPKSHSAIGALPTRLSAATKLNTLKVGMK